MIADVNYYNTLGFKNTADVQELERALARAERLIHLLTCGKCSELDNLSEKAQVQLKYAICAQAERYITHGFSEGESDCKIKIGDFSYESKSNGVLENVAPVALAALKLSGLLYAGTEAV